MDRPFALSNDKWLLGHFAQAAPEKRTSRQDVPEQQSLWVTSAFSLDLATLHQHHMRRFLEHLPFSCDRGTLQVRSRPMFFAANRFPLRRTMR